MPVLFTNDIILLRFVCQLLKLRNSNLRNNYILKFEKYLFLAYKKGNVLKIDKTKKKSC